MCIIKDYNFLSLHSFQENISWIEIIKNEIKKNNIFLI